MWDCSIGYKPQDNWTKNELPDWARLKILPEIFHTKNFKDTLVEMWPDFYEKLGVVRNYMLDYYDRCYAADRANKARWSQGVPIDIEGVEYLWGLLSNKAAWINDHIQDIEIQGGVAAIDFSRPLDVYNLQSMRVLGGADAARVNALPAGLYIIDGKKVLVK